MQGIKVGVKTLRVADENCTRLWSLVQSQPFFVTPDGSTIQVAIVLYYTRRQHNHSLLHQTAAQYKSQSFFITPDGSIITLYYTRRQHNTSRNRSLLHQMAAQYKSQSLFITTDGSTIHACDWQLDGRTWHLSLSRGPAWLSATEISKQRTL